MMTNIYCVIYDLIISKQYIQVEKSKRAMRKKEEPQLQKENQSKHF